MMLPPNVGETITSPRSKSLQGGIARDALLLTTDFRPRLGGIAEYLGGLWREAEGWGRPRVYSTVPGDERADGFTRTLPPPPERKLGSRAGDRLPAIRRLNTLTHFAALWRYARRTLGPVLARSDDRSRICIGIWNPLAHFWCETLAAAGRPYALFAHGLDVIQPLYGTVAPWRVRDFRRAARVITCSGGTGSLTATRLGVDPACVRVVHPGIDISGHTPPAGDGVDRLRDTLGITRERVVLSVGRLVRRKGFDRALRAFAAHRATGQAARYIIAGDGPERQALEDLAGNLGVRDDVRFMGEVDDSTKLALYELCDVFVMPNTLLDNADWEGFGIVFLEAARAGKPAIGGANGGVPDAIEHERTGLLVDPEDPSAVASALTALLVNDELREQLGAAARARAAAEFDWPVVGERFRRVLQESW